MAYKALYRTYRPQSFSSIIGQEAIVRTLQNEIKENKISHAYLFSGPRGTGKTSIARVFAKALNCTNPHGTEPCNECAICKEITDGVNPDVIEIDAASNNGVDEIRAMKDRICFLPAGSKYKIYIIDEVHMLSTSAFNALLKTLEEPPKHVIFILATTEPHKILPTVLSRCQRYDFKSLTVEEISGLLANVCEKENVEYDNDALLHIAQASEGGLRDALSYLDQAMSFSNEKITDEDVASVTGMVTKGKLLDLAQSLKDKDLSKSLNILDELHNEGKEISKIVIGLLEFYRDILLSKNLKEYKDERYEKFASDTSFDQLFYYIDVLSDVQNKIKYSNSPSIYLEVGIIRIVNTSSNDLDYLKRISTLEDRIKNLAQNTNNSSNSNTSMNTMDNRKLREIEDKFNSLLAFLSKMELQKVNDRLASLEEANNTNKVEQPVTSISKELEIKINTIIEDIEFLKITHKTMQNEIENTQSGDVDDEKLSAKIEEVAKRYKPSINYTEIETFVKKQVNELLEDIKVKIEKLEEDEEIKQSTLERLEKLEENNQIPATTVEKIVEVKNEPVDLSEIEERISKFESSIYKMISNLFASQGSKKKKQKIDDKQISFWNGDVVGVDKINTPSSKVKVDFEDLNKNSEEKQDEKKTDNQMNIFEYLDDEKSENSEQVEKSEESNEETEKTMEQNMEESKEIEFEPEDNLEQNIDINIEPEKAEDLDEPKESIVQEEIIKEETNEDNHTFENDIDNYEQYDEPNEETFEDPHDFEIKEEPSEVGYFDEPSGSGINLFASDDKDLSLDEDIALEEKKKEARQDEVKQILLRKKEEIEGKNKGNLFDNRVLKEIHLGGNKNENNIDDEIKVEEPISENKPLDLGLNSTRVVETTEEKPLVKEKIYKPEEDLGLNSTRIVNNVEDLVIKEETVEAEKPEKESTDLDEYERYDVKVLERILNDCRVPEFSSEKDRIMSMWKNLLDLAPGDKRGTAEILHEGTVRAVGNHEFVITYDKASICNQVMSRKFKRNALKLLYDLLSGDYNYLAITNEQWYLKRQEYSDQYHIGTAKIRLTPFTDPNLRVQIIEDESEIMERKVKEIFGDIVNIKRSDK